jgi:hypothetical protein
MTEQEAFNDPEMKTILLLSGYVRELSKGADYETTTYKLAETLVKVFSRSPSDEDIREPIQNAIYATGRFTTDQCTEFADGILTYLNEAGFKVVRQ